MMKKINRNICHIDVNKILMCTYPSLVIFIMWEGYNHRYRRPRLLTYT